MFPRKVSAVDLLDSERTERSGQSKFDDSTDRVCKGDRTLASCTETGVSQESAHVTGVRGAMNSLGVGA